MMFTRGRPAPTQAVPQRRPIRRPRRLLLIGSTAALAMLASCGGDDDATSSDPAPADPTTTESPSTPDNSTTSTSGDGKAADGVLPDACDVIDLEDWEAITALDLTVPEQDTELPLGGTGCGVTADGTELPYLVIVQVAPIDSPGSVENLTSFLDDYDGMEQIDGIGDRALYWDQDATYEGDTITDFPILAFEDGVANVTITLNADSLGRAALEQLAKAVADKI